MIVPLAPKDAAWFGLRVSFTGVGLGLVFCLTCEPCLAIIRVNNQNYWDKYQPCYQQGARHYQAIIYGDEPAGLMTALELNRQLAHGTYSKNHALQWLLMLTLAED